MPLGCAEAGEAEDFRFDDAGLIVHFRKPQARDAAQSLTTRAALLEFVA